MTAVDHASAPASRRAVEPPRLLLVSYAFPPIHVQMTPPVVKAMAAFRDQGYEVDVVCAAPFSPLLATDDSLGPYSRSRFGTIIRVAPDDGILDRLRRRSHVLSTVPDIMHCLAGPTFRTLMGMSLDRYRAIVTWSPFHSVNPVMARIKMRLPHIRWIAQFGDPWAHNPLETSRLRRTWNRWQEPKTVAVADFIIHSSASARELMFRRAGPDRWARSAVIPHCFDNSLYPQRPPASNPGIVLRYVGMLFGHRTPEPLFLALTRLLAARPHLASRLTVELVGTAPPEMLQSPAARALPEGMVKSIGSVGYVRSLELMHDADILVLIEAQTSRNLFMSSKVADYVGSGTPIVGILPAGPTDDAVAALRWRRARPDDIAGIADALEAAIDAVESGAVNGRLGAGDQGHAYSNIVVAKRYLEILEAGP